MGGRALSASSATEGLAALADAWQRDLPALFGHRDLRIDASAHEVVVVSDAGRARVAWPFKLEAEGRLGRDARIAMELLLASSSPETFWTGYRPPSAARRRAFFDALGGYVSEVFDENRFFQPLAVEERDAALLVLADDEYALVADDGHHRGEGVLHWKVKRLVVYALTDTT